MAEVGWFSELFVVLNRRLLEKKVRAQLPGGWALAEMPEKTDDDPKLGSRPYGVVMPAAVRDQKFTNKTKYANLEFQFYVEADTFEELEKTIIPAVTAALQHAAGLTVGDGTLKVTMIRPGDVEYEKIENIWTGAATFMVQANQPAASSVA